MKIWAEPPASYSTFSVIKNKIYNYKFSKYQKKWSQGM